MACTCSSTSVAVSSRPSSRGPALAISTIACARRKTPANRRAENNFLSDINAPKGARKRRAALERPAGTTSLPLVRGRENPCRVGVAMMSAVIIHEPGGCLLCGRVLRTHGRQQFGARLNEQGLALRRFVAGNQRPAQACLAARRAPAIRTHQSGIHLQRRSKFRLRSRGRATSQQDFAQHLVRGGYVQVPRGQLFVVDGEGLARITLGGG